MILATLLLATTATTAPAPVVRISPDQSVVTATLAEAAVDDDSLMATKISFVTSDGSKVKAAFTLRCGASTWKWESRRAFTLRRSETYCTLAIRADDYRTPAEAPLPASGAVMRRLERLPVL